MLGRDLAGQQRNDVTRLALAVDPVLIVGFGHRRETDLLIQFVGGEQDVLEHRGSLHGIRNFNRDAERQGVVDHRLTNIENVHATLGEDAGDGRSETGTVDTSDVNQDDFAQGAPRSGKNRILTTFSDHRAQAALCRHWVARYTARQLHRKSRAL